MQPTDMQNKNGMNLPQPVVEAGGPLDIATPIQQTAAPQQNPLDQALNTATSDPMATDLSANISVPQIAEDNDLIEKEWVTKTKKIYDANRNDPYKLAKDLNIFKAEYLKKRYNKTIKLSE